MPASPGCVERVGSAITGVLAPTRLFDRRSIRADKRLTAMRLADVIDRHPNYAPQGVPDRPAGSHGLGQPGDPARLGPREVLRFKALSASDEQARHRSVTS